MVSARYLEADILVITNARLDHRLEQGTAADAALAFAATIPPGGTVVSSDAANRPLWEKAATERGARLVFIDPAEGENLGDMPENVACALGVANLLGLARDRAAMALSVYKKDPGAFAESSWSREDGSRTIFLDASAANEPGSTDRLARLAYAHAGADAIAAMHRVLAVATRADRPDRSIQFAEYATLACIPGGLYDEVAFLGPVHLAVRAVLRRSGIRYRFLRRPSELETAPGLAGAPSGSGAEPARIIVAAGNRGGHGKLLHDWAMEKAGTPEAI